jgi:hypothetical protein
MLPMTFFLLLLYSIVYQNFMFSTVFFSNNKWVGSYSFEGNRREPPRSAISKSRDSKIIDFLLMSHLVCISKLPSSNFIMCNAWYIEYAYIKLKLKTGQPNSSSFPYKKVVCLLLHATISVVYHFVC